MHIDRGFPEAEARSIVLQIVLLLQYLQQIGVTNRDIKVLPLPYQPIFIYTFNNECLILKLESFFYAKGHVYLKDYVFASTYPVMTKSYGSPGYIGTKLPSFLFFPVRGARACACTTIHGHGHKRERERERERDGCMRVSFSMAMRDHWWALGLFRARSAFPVVSWGREQREQREERNMEVSQKP